MGQLRLRKVGEMVAVNVRLASPLAAGLSDSDEIAAFLLDAFDRTPTAHVSPMAVAVVSGKEDDRVVVDAKILEQLNDLPDRLIHVRDHGGPFAMAQVGETLAPGVFGLEWKSGRGLHAGRHGDSPRACR